MDEKQVKFIINKDETSSNNSSDKEHKLRKKFDIGYKPFVKCKSTSGLLTNKKPIFQSVVEEKFDEEEKDKQIEKFHMLNEKIQSEGFDNLEEIIIDHKKPKRFNKSNKALSLIDPVIESDMQDEIDFEGLKIAPFKKLKLLTDYEEDKKMKINSDTGSLHVQHNVDIDDAIAEDTKENDVDEMIKPKKKNSSMKHITDFVDKSDMIDEPKSPRDIIVEEIKEDPENEDNQLLEELDEIITEEKCKII